MDPPSITQSNGPLTLEKPTFEASLHPSKGELRHTTHNLNAWDAQHYNIVEYLSQALCTMSMLEALQSFPTQWNALLTAIGAIDSTNASLLFFNPENNEPCLSHTIAFHISVCCLGKNVHRMVLEEGVATYNMSYSCWQALDSPRLATSKTILKAFDGHMFTPNGILVMIPIDLGGKTVMVKVQVVNASLYYNLFLRR